jgi:tetratricopeptide (TPR) repeat protein
LGQLYWLRKEPDKAIAALERAIAINPNGAHAYAHLGNLFTALGRPEEGIKLIEKAMRLDPIPPDFYLTNLGVAYRFVGQYEDAIELYRRVLQRSPDNLFAHIGLTAAYSASGREEEARHQSQELLKLDPTFSLDKYAERVLIKDEVQRERFFANLRNAGLK